MFLEVSSSKGDEGKRSLAFVIRLLRVEEVVTYLVEAKAAFIHGRRRLKRPSSYG